MEYLEFALCVMMGSINKHEYVCCFFSSPQKPFSFITILSSTPFTSSGWSLSQVLKVRFIRCGPSSNAQFPFDSSSVVDWNPPIHTGPAIYSATTSFSCLIQISAKDFSYTVAVVWHLSQVFWSSYIENKVFGILSRLFSPYKQALLDEVLPVSHYDGGEENMYR